MFLIDLISPTKLWQTALIDATLILCFSFPVIYSFLIRPLVKQIERREFAESILKKSEERYRSIFENINDIYYETMLDGTITEVSPSIRYISKGLLSRSEILGTSVYDLYDNPAERDVLLSVLTKEGHVKDYEIALRNRDGMLFMCSVSATVIFDNQNNPRKITGSLRDISARKKTEEVILRMNEQLRIANKEKDRLFSIIAHDLRGPLSTFIGLTAIMAGKWDELKPAEIQKFSDSMHKSATNLYGLLENLLLWSKSKHDTFSVELQNIALLQTINEAVSGLMASAESKEIHFTSLVDPELIIRADPYYLQIIIRNLTSNAIKFTRRGGSVIIKAEVNSNTTHISVSDTGIGMNEEILSGLFGFEGNINRQGTENEPSTGLGLILCQELTEKLGGKLNVKSEENAGSSFTLSL